MSKVPPPEEWAKAQFKKAKSERQVLSGINEFRYEQQCQRCLELIDCKQIPWIATFCCYCWKPSEDEHYWRRWWQFVFGEVRFFNEYRIIHKSPSLRALNQLRRVVALARPPAGFTVDEIEEKFVAAQLRRFAVIQNALLSAYGGSQYRNEFIEWREAMKPLVEEVLVLQPMPEWEKPKPILKRKRLVDPNIKQLKLF